MNLPPELKRVAEPATPEAAAELIDAVDQMPVAIERDGKAVAVLLTAAQFDELHWQAGGMVGPRP